MSAGEPSKELAPEAEEHIVYTGDGNPERGSHKSAHLRLPREKTQIETAIERKKQ